MEVVVPARINAIKRDLNVTIKLLTMGGTIDKDYFDALSEYQVVESILPQEVARIGINAEFDVESICRKDSLEVTSDDRAALRAAIEASSYQQILVSHGTDTMVETAASLNGIADKVIILFGAMRPIRFKDTDGLFNAAFAIGALQASAPGVYIAMSCQLFRPDEVVKNREQARFELK